MNWREGFQEAHIHLFFFTEVYWKRIEQWFLIYKCELFFGEFFVSPYILNIYPPYTVNI